MAFREKLAWVTLLVTVLIYGGYFITVGPGLLAGTISRAGFMLPLGLTILAIVVAQIVLTSAFAIADPAGAKAPRDEREGLIALRSNRAGFYTLQVGAFAAITILYWWNDAGVMANGVLLAMIIAELVRSGWQIIAYRRGAA